MAASRSDPGPASGYCHRRTAPAAATSTECAGCGRALDPPRFCPECGRRMTVTVIPTGWVARCRDHAELRSA